MKTEIRRYSKTLVGSVAMLLVTGAGAQEQESFFEEIVVTAQKREQGLQDVPISISVLTGDKFQEAGIETLDDLTLYVPTKCRSSLSFAMNCRSPMSAKFCVVNFGIIARDLGLSDV